METEGEEGGTGTLTVEAMIAVVAMVVTGEMTEETGVETVMEVGVTIATEMIAEIAMGVETEVETVMEVETGVEETVGKGRATVTPGLEVQLEEVVVVDAEAHHPTTPVRGKLCLKVLLEELKMPVFFVIIWCFCTRYDITYSVVTIKFIFVYFCLLLFKLIMWSTCVPVFPVY